VEELSRRRTTSSAVSSIVPLGKTHFRGLRSFLRRVVEVVGVVHRPPSKEVQVVEVR
jgi:hypothetical protein